MALSIKTAEADRLARQLAAETHESLTEAVTVALRERLERVRGVGEPDTFRAVRRLQIEFARGATHDPRTDEEILGYDEQGLPT